MAVPAPCFDCTVRCCKGDEDDLTTFVVLDCDLDVNHTAFGGKSGKNDREGGGARGGGLRPPPLNRCVLRCVCTCVSASLVIVPPVVSTLLTLLATRSNLSAPFCTAAVPAVSGVHRTRQ